MNAKTQDGTSVHLQQWGTGRIVNAWRLTLSAFDLVT